MRRHPLEFKRQTHLRTDFLAGTLARGRRSRHLPLPACTAENGEIFPPCEEGDAAAAPTFETLVVSEVIKSYMNVGKNLHGIRFYCDAKKP